MDEIAQTLAAGLDYEMNLGSETTHDMETREKALGNWNTALGLPGQRPL